MKLWRCEICGDPYLGETKPSNCPFCGAARRFLVKQKNYSNQTGPIENLSEISKKNLETTLALEVNATKIYLCASDKSNNDEIKNLFKALAGHEMEHVSLVTKALGTSKPATDLDKTLCANDDIENIAKTAALEETAMKLYSKFLSESTEKRVQNIFTALIDVESDHLKLANKKLNQAKFT